VRRPFREHGRPVLDAAGAVAARAGARVGEEEVDGPPARADQDLTQLAATDLDRDAGACGLATALGVTYTGATAGAEVGVGLVAAA
jgi:hypothetical protein